MPKKDGVIHSKNSNSIQICIEKIESYQNLYRKTISRKWHKDFPLMKVTREISFKMNLIVIDH